jgi:serine/threonine protein kinase
VQIAHGLAAAHEKGITHRDLKPENLFVTTDSRVKILDFGLAKLTQTEAAGPADASALPTTPAFDAAQDRPFDGAQDRPNTLSGMVLGTVGYMSPEQVRGQKADHRSDIFAFGAILYEMLSGHRAFRGDTPADTMSAILAKDPPELSTDERQISPALARIVDRCLEKSPSARFQTTSDLAFALEGLLTHSDRGVPSSIHAGRKRSNAWLAWALALIATVMALAVTGTVVLWPRSGPPRAAARAGPPVIVLMDSPHPERVYDPETRKTGGTNADDLTDLLRDLPNPLTGAEIKKRIEGMLQVEVSKSPS